MRAEALSPALVPTPTILSQAKAPAFLDNFDAKRSNIGTEPAVYSNTEIMGDDFDAFLLRSLLPNTGFEVHIAKCSVKGKEAIASQRAPEQMGGKTRAAGYRLALESRSPFVECVRDTSPSGTLR